MEDATMSPRRPFHGILPAMAVPTAMEAGLKQSGVTRVEIV
jgi:hypothetical protein